MAKKKKNPIKNKVSFEADLFKAADKLIKAKWENIDFEKKE